MTESARNRIVIAREPGGPDVLDVVSRPVPTPAPGEIRIRNITRGINRPDQIERLGFYPAPAGAPEGLGLEVSGHVDALGEGVDGFAIGDPVCALVAGGGYADWSVAPAGSVLPVPDRVSVADAAGLPETVFTVWTNVFEIGALSHGETFLVHGGTSGIGSTAIQMAKAAGARVIATAGTAEKVALCETLGADIAINYRTADFEAVVNEAGGADVILDMVGGSYVQKNINCARMRWTDRLHRLSHRQPRRARSDAGHAQAVDADGFDPARPSARGEGPTRRRSAPDGLALDRQWTACPGH